jgi:hypothetical protein
MQVQSYKRFLDYDKKEKVLYDNIYLSSHKVVIKTPLSRSKDNQEDLLLEEFDLAKYTYLIGY